jgi:hypothetical protein
MAMPIMRMMGTASMQHTLRSRDFKTCIEEGECGVPHLLDALFADRPRNRIALLERLAAHEDLGGGRGGHVLLAVVFGGHSGGGVCLREVASSRRCIASRLPRRRLPARPATPDTSKFKFQRMSSSSSSSTAASAAFLRRCEFAQSVALPAPCTRGVAACAHLVAVAAPPPHAGETHVFARDPARPSQARLMARQHNINRSPVAPICCE